MFLGNLDRQRQNWISILSELLILTFYYYDIDFKGTRYKISLIIKFYISTMVRLFPMIVSFFERQRWSLCITPFRYEHFYCARYICIAAPAGFHFSRTEQHVNVAFYERHACERGFRRYDRNFESQFLCTPFLMSGSPGGPHPGLSTKRRFTSIRVSESTWNVSFLPRIYRRR